MIVLVVDYWWQYAHMIAKKIRSLWCKSEIIASDEELLSTYNIEDVWAIILSWGPHSVYEAWTPRLHKSILVANSDYQVPVLWICYGHQLLCSSLWWEVRPGNSNEYGKATLSVHDTSFPGELDQSTMWMSHGDSVTQLPEGRKILWSTDDCATAFAWDIERKLFWVQFHPEVTHSTWWDTLLSHFLFEIAGLAKTWSAWSQKEHIIEEIKQEAWDRNVFMLVSWWVDSTVAFALLNTALGKGRVYGLCIDTWLMRKGEIARVKDALEKLGRDNFWVEDASAYFLDRLSGITDPEEKRKIIWTCFIEIQQQLVSKMDLDPELRMLGQWTIYPDIIESKWTKDAHLIKTHHNRVEGIQKLIEAGHVIEPLKDLYKDEVRSVWRSLWLPHELVERHPFPWPGLWIRILCSDGSAEKPIADYEIKDWWWSVLLPFRSVWVQGDGRSYRHPLVVRDHAWKADWEEYESLATTLINSSKTVNRVLRRVWWKNPMHVSLQSVFVDTSSVSLLQEADALCTQRMTQHGLQDTIWQMPVVLVPWWTQEWLSLVLRPVSSNEAMTASFSFLDFSLVQKLVDELTALPWIECVFYDITHKPPGTIEWE